MKNLFSILVPSEFSGEEYAVAAVSVVVILFVALMAG